MMMKIEKILIKVVREKNSKCNLDIGTCRYAIAVLKVHVVVVVLWVLCRRLVCVHHLRWRQLWRRLWLNKLLIEIQNIADRMRNAAMREARPVMTVARRYHWRWIMVVVVVVVGRRRTSARWRCVGRTFTLDGRWRCVRIRWIDWVVEMWMRVRHGGRCRCAVMMVMMIGDFVAENPWNWADTWHIVLITNAIGEESIADFPCEDAWVGC